MKDDIKLKHTSFIINKLTEKFKDHYLVGQSMGCSYFGEVRKCRHETTNQVKAVKILRKEKLGKKQSDRFMHELQVLQRLDHQSILKINELYEDDTRYYLIMECCTGGELYDEICMKG